MKTISKIYLLLVFFLSNSYLIAQTSVVDTLPVGPFLYTPPEGINRYSYAGAQSNYEIFTMDMLSALSPADDGLMIAWDLSMDLKQNEGTPLMSFSVPGFIDFFIEIYYSSRTATIRRYNLLEGKAVSYDYHLFDPLFKDTTGIVTWRMKVYFTSSFMFMVAGEKISPYKYMSPVYFGLDSQEKYPSPYSVMYQIINRKKKAYITLGSFSSKDVTIGNVIINSFVYSDPSAPDDWWRTMQREFASPNPPTSNN
jgi:hypothetical protein